jgi:thioredoxin reductase (NADPH)
MHSISFAYMEESVYDIIIVGGGPIGLACAIEAKKAGLSHLIIEKGAFVNSLFNYPVHMTFFSTSEKLEIGDIPFVSIAPKPGRNEALEYYRRAATNYRLNIHLFEEVTNAMYQTETFVVSTSKRNYQARKIVIATGFYNIPFLLKVPGEELSKVTHYYKDPALYAFQKVLVVGANNSAVDAALETWRKGAEVTMVIKGGEIGNRVKYWVKPDIENRIKEGSIKAFFDSVITEIKEDEVIIQTPAGRLSIPNDFVIAATGYQPNLDFLQKLGVQLRDNENSTPVYETDTHETNIPGLYIAGVICGGKDTHSLFIENSREHAVKIVADILSKP